MSSHLPGGAHASTRRPAPRAPHMTAARSRAGLRRRARALLTPLLVLGLTVLPSAALAAAPAASSSAHGLATATDPAATPAADEVSTTLVSMSPMTVGPDDTVTVVVRVRNGTTDTIDSPRATLGVNWRLVSTRSALQAWADAPTSNRVAEPMAVEDLAPLGPGKEATVTFTVPAEDFTLQQGSTWGPRPLSMTITDDGERLDVLRTFFLWGESEGPAPVRLSLLAPVTGPPQSTEEAVGADPRLGRLVAATADVPEIAWALDPALLAAAESSAHSDASSWAASVHEGAVGRTVFALRPYDPDVAAYAQAGAPLPGVSTPLPGGATLDPAWRTDLAYPADEVPDLRAVRTSVQAGSPLVVVRGAGLAPEDSVSYSPTGLATVPTDAGPATALVADEGLTSAVIDATRSSGAGASTADATQRLLADLAVIASERPTDSRHLLVALPRSWDPDPDAVTSLLTALGAASWVEVSDVVDLLGASVPDVARNALPETATADGALPTDEMNVLQRARTEVAAFATITADPAAIVQQIEPSLVAPTAVAYRAMPEERTAAVGLAVKDAATLQSSVSIVPRGLDVTLINTSGKIPVRVRNALDQPVTVQVALRPDSARLKVVSFPVETIPPGAEVDFKVPVEAIGSGDVGVQVELLSVPAGAVVSPPSEFVVQVRAAWESTGTAIFAGLVALLMVGGIWRTIRRGRSPRRVAELTPATGVPHAQGAPPSSGTTTDGAP
jgi:hypothetical protein